MTRGRHRDLKGLFEDIAEALNEEGSMTTAELRDYLWKNGYSSKYKTRQSLHRTLGYKREEVVENQSVETKKAERGQGSMLPWVWRFSE